MSDILRYIIMFSRLFLMSAPGAAAMFFLVKTMCGQKRSGWYYVIYWTYRFFVQEVLIAYVLSAMYQDELWYQIFYSTVTTSNFIIGTMVYWFVFSGDILKKTLAGLMVDCVCGACYTIPVMIISEWQDNFYYVNMSGQFNYYDLLIPILGTMIFYPIYRCLYPRLLRFRTYKLKYRPLWWGVVIGMFTHAFFNNQAVKLIWNNQENAVVFQMPIAMFSFLLAAGISGLWIYSRSLRKKHVFLQENIARMEKHYDAMNRQIKQMEIQQEEMAETFRKIEKIQNTEERHIISSDNRISSETAEWMKEYMKTLQQRYDDLKLTLFCDDYTVDAVLSGFAEYCRQQNIETDLLFQGCQRKEIKEEDMIRIINQLLECGMSAVQISLKENLIHSQKCWIRLHVANVKNQMIFSLEAICLKKLSIKRRAFRPWIKKYEGVMDIRQENGKLELVLGLKNEA